MRYWQHEETGRCVATEDFVPLKRYFEITKEKYEAYEKNCCLTTVVADTPCG
jgi:hypothetical protein